MFFGGRSTRSLVLVGLVMVLLASGCEFRYRSFTIDRTGFTVNGIGDNVANLITFIEPVMGPVERIGLRAFDGAGNVIYWEDVYAQVPVGYSPSDAGFYFDSITWARAPRYNPITVEYYNPPTDLLPAEILIARFTGEIPGLPFFGAQAPGEPAQPPDDRLNWGYCDLKAAIYQRTGPDGTPALHVYGIDGASDGHFLLDVTGPDLAPYIAEPPQGQNVLIEEAGHVQLYALISGEFSLHIHMDDQGNVCAWVFDGLPPANTHVVNYNMYE